MDSPTAETLLYEYNLEAVDPRGPWDQEQLYGFESLVALEHLQLLSDEIEQHDNIDAVGRLKQAKEKERN